MKRRIAIGLSIAVLATIATVALARPGKIRFTAIDRCLADSRAWDYRASRCVALPAGPVDRIVVDKSKRTLATYRDGRLIRIFRVALGRGGLAPKSRQGDGRVPEGNYSITYHNVESRYHRSLRIGYPTEEQRA